MYATSLKLKKIYSYELDNRAKQEISTILPLYAVSYALHNNIFMVRIRNFCSKRHHRSMRMKIIKNTLRQKKFTVELGISSA